MKLKFFALFAIAAALAGCGSWVDTDDATCTEEAIKEANQNILIMGAMGTAYCAAKGEGAFDGEFRCNGSILQVKCKG